MAFSLSFNIVCANAGNAQSNFSNQALLQHAVWSESQAGTSGVTTHSTGGSGNGLNLVRVRVLADSYIAFDDVSATAVTKAADANNGPRIPIAANTDYDFYVSNKKFVAWINA